MKNKITRTRLGKSILGLWVIISKRIGRGLNGKKDLLKKNSKKNGIDNGERSGKDGRAQ